MESEISKRRGAIAAAVAITIIAVAGVIAGLQIWNVPGETAESPRPEYHRRYPIDSGGFFTITQFITPWKPDATLAEIADAWRGQAERAIEGVNQEIAQSEHQSANDKFLMLHTKTILLNNAGRPEEAYEVLKKSRELVESSGLAQKALFSVIFYQGLTALRRGETDNCILCRGESSCIIPISPAARHTNPEGSRLAIRHFTEYLERFPDDTEVQWLLNIAHMTLGEYPDRVDPRYLVRIDPFLKSEFDIGKFRDIGHIVGLNQLTQGGGGIMEDFDGDGLLDIVISAFDPTTSMQFLRNTGQGTFEDKSVEAGLSRQFGGIHCMQTDYNNDGRMDIFVVRGAWLPIPMPPSLLRNDGNGSFTDVTAEAGLLNPANSISAAWADYDNDGWLDLFVCCERQSSHLYHNLGNGKFEDVAWAAGISLPDGNTKGASWIDFDNDGYQDLFVNFMTQGHGARLFHNNRDGTFLDVSKLQGIDGPLVGFACWTWDYDNDGWQDLFATSYDKGLGEIVKGLQGEPHSLRSNRLYRNKQGQGFQNVTGEAGLDMVFATMGCNFGDFDNDGFLDMYLGTGDPDLATLVPNRMFRNVDGKRFSEITVSAGVGHLQKGHGTAIGDWDRDGNNDIFMEMGGAVNGDVYHNILFQNPGHDNRWLTVKLNGVKTNRPAIGARIKVVTAGPRPQTLHYHISSGSSFGANPMQRTIGLGKADRVALLEIHWPTSGTTQAFRDIAVNQAIDITEFAETYQTLDWAPIKIPQLRSGAKMGGK